jgi:enamine deaminase RidA (YjgF/YER057c/UK114 family)
VSPHAVEPGLARAAVSRQVRPPLTRYKVIQWLMFQMGGHCWAAHRASDKIPHMKKAIVAPEFPCYPSDWHFSPGIEASGFVFLSGITGVRPDQSVATDAATQFHGLHPVLERVLNRGWFATHVHAQLLELKAILVS